MRNLWKPNKQIQKCCPFNIWRSNSKVQMAASQYKQSKKLICNAYIQIKIEMLKLMVNWQKQHSCRHPAQDIAKPERTSMYWIKYKDCKSQIILSSQRVSVREFNIGDHHLLTVKKKNIPSRRDRQNINYKEITSKASIIVFEKNMLPEVLVISTSCQLCKPRPKIFEILKFSFKNFKTNSWNKEGPISRENSHMFHIQIPFFRDL